jgi:DNA-binding transcriptional MocR family regulator
MSVQSGSTHERVPRYELLANHLSRQIEIGAYSPGYRIPSVRQASKEQGLSISTVLQAYQLLEDQGWIEARPQSGYYVRLRTTGPAPEPPVSAPPLEPSQVGINDLALRMVHDSAVPGIIQLGAALPDPDLLPHQKLNKLMAAILKHGDARLNLCGIPEGIEELRIAVVQRAARAGAQLNPDEIIVTNGAMEALNLALRAVCQPGDLVAVESPTYFGMFQALESLQLRVLEIPTHHQTGINLEALRFALEHYPVKALMLIPNFSNPLGSIMPEGNKRLLAALLEEYDIPLIEDDIYGELHFDDARPQSVKKYDTQGRILLCSSFSKDISPSFRVGWIAPGRYYEKVRRMKMALNLGTAILPQMTIASFLSSGGYDHYLRRLRREYAQRVGQMSQFVHNHFPEGTRVTCPRGGFVLWVQLPGAVDSLAIYQPALEAGISIAPGYMFSTTQKYRGYIRLNAAYWSYKILGALERLAQIVKDAVPSG